MVNVPKWNTLAASKPVAPALRTLDEMRQRADAAGGDHRHAHGAAGGAQQIEIEAPPGAVTVHAGQQDFAGTERDHLAAPVDRVDPGVAGGRRG